MALGSAQCIVKWVHACLLAGEDINISIETTFKCSTAQMLLICREAF